MSKQPDNRSRAEKRAESISTLEQKIRTLLSNSQLGEKAKFHYNKEENTYYVEIKKSDGMDKNCIVFRRLVLESLTLFHPEIKGIMYEKPYPGANSTRAYLVLNPEAEIFDKNDFIKKVLIDFKDCLEVYLKRYNS